MVLGKRVLIGLVAGALIASAAQAQSVRLLGDYSDWSAYTASEGAGKVCFVLSQPEDVRPEPQGYDEAYLYLTHRPSEGVRSEFNLIAGYDFAPESEPTLSIDGQTYPLFAESDSAWLDDPAQGDTVAGRMRAGATLTVTGTSAQGTEVVQTFSLSGVTAASRAIDQECG